MERLPLIRIQRFFFTDYVTVGNLDVFEKMVGQRVFSCHTIERPWLGNAPWISCIPAGFYVVRRDTFKNKYPDLRFLEVTGRTDIEIHRANLPQQLNGCIAPVTSVIKEGTVCIGKDSKLALDGLLQSLGDENEKAYVLIENKRN